MKKFFQRYLPPIAQIKSHPGLQFLGKRLHDPNLWHLNRRSLAGGTAIGLFSAFIPIPMQMALAALLAILFRVNLPLAVALVWTTNPITMPPIFYFAYLLGSVLLRIPPQQLEFQFSSQWFLATLKPFLLGCMVLSTVSALAGYWLIIGLWRLQVNCLWRDRCRRRLQSEKTVIKPKKFGKLENLP
jgi:uncharacterized protein